MNEQTKELVQERDLLQSDYTDLTDTVEISLLDKEVAEERFEQAESTLESTKEKLAELEIEIGVLRQENSRMDGSKAVTMGESSGGDSGTNSLAFVQMEKQNARLKEALVRYDSPSSPDCVVS
jgi:dynactin 1